MREILVGALVSFGALSTASAASLCTAGPIDVTASTVISCGGLTFSNFEVTAAAPGTVPSVSYLGSSVSDGNVTINFNPSLSGAAGPQDVWFYFAVSGATVNSVQLMVAGSNATVDETVCDSPIARTGASANVCAGATLANIVAFSPPAASSANATITPASAVYIFKDVGIGSGGGLTSFSQMYGTGQGNVPEPATVGLVGAGLLVLLCLRRRIL